MGPFSRSWERSKPARGEQTLRKVPAGRLGTGLDDAADASKDRAVDRPSAVRYACWRSGIGLGRPVGVAAAPPVSSSWSHASIAEARKPR